MGPDFQAELPKCFVNGPETFPPAEEPCSEQLLWKPTDELKESTGLQQKGTRPQKKKVKMEIIFTADNSITRNAILKASYRLKKTLFFFTIMLLTF